MKKLLALLAASATLLAASPALGHAAPSLSTVLSHTRAAEVAKTRAVAEFEEHAFAKGKAPFAANRSHMAAAVAETAQLIQEADTPAERRAAAEAVVAVAMQAGRNEVAFARVARVLVAGSSLQLRVVAAARDDAGRIATAISQLEELLASVPEAGRRGIANAIAQLTLDRRAAVAELGKDVTSSTIGMTAKEVAAAAIKEDVRGQELAVELLQALKPLLPADAREGIATALAAIADSLDAQAEALGAVSANAPSDSIKAVIDAAIALAREAAAKARA